MGEQPPRTPFSRSQWPEYTDGLSLDARAHRDLAERIIDKDAPPVPRGDWARRFDVSAAGWALADVYAPGGGGLSPVYVVYPIDLGSTGTGLCTSGNCRGARAWSFTSTAWWQVLCRSWVKCSGRCRSTEGPGSSGFAGPTRQGTHWLHTWGRSGRTRRCGTRRVRRRPSRRRSMLRTDPFTRRTGSAAGRRWSQGTDRGVP